MVLNVGVVWCGIVVDVEWCKMWTVAVMWNMGFEMWWCEMVVPRQTAV